MVKVKIKENRRAEEARKRGKAKVDFEQAGQSQAKIDIIAEYLGLKETEEKEDN